MSNEKEMSEDDYLRKHLEENDLSKKSKNSDLFDVVQQQTSSSRTTDLQYISSDIKGLPCGQFYPEGTVLLIRAAQVKEIQSYSMVDDNNFYDVVEKMNDMLQSCVRLKYIDGKFGSFLDIKDQDRLYLIFMIRELTFQKGNDLAVNAKCSCGQGCQIELKRSNFKFQPLDPKISKYYNKSSNSFIFNVKNGKKFELTPPNIGLQKSFTEYIIKENNDKRPPNLAFLKNIPFTLNGRNNITYDGIKSKVIEFENMDDVSFQFLNGAVSKLSFGIKDLSKSCESCGLEVRADMQFPNGASGIFVIHNAFETFIQE